MLRLKRYLLASVSIAALGAAGVVLTGGSLLLSGETDGMASDFTVASGNGDVSVKDVATPGNVKTNVIADAFWSNAGTSPKMITTSAGALAWSPHNLILQSQTLATTWTAVDVTVTSNALAAPDGTTTAELITEGSAGTAFFSQPVTTLANAPYVFSLYAKRGNTDWVRVVFYDSVGGTNRVTAWFNLNTGAAGSVANGGTAIGAAALITDVGGGWYRISVSGAIVETTGSVGIVASSADNVTTRVNGATYNLWGAQANRGTVPTTYLVTTTGARMGLAIDYANSSYGLLVEPAATNLLLRSQEAENAAWTVQDTIAANDTTAPDSTTTADKATALATQQQAITITANSTYTISLYVKRSTAVNVRIVLLETAASTNRFSAWFNLSTAAVGTASAGGTGAVTSSSITALGDSWYRITATGSVGNSATAVTFLFGMVTADAGVGIDTGKILWLWGAQAELGSVSTSHIQTFAATVTRATDQVSKVTSAFPYGAASGLWYEAVYSQPISITDTGSPVAIAFDDGASTERIMFSRTLTTNVISFSVLDNNVSQASVDSAAVAGSTMLRHAARWAANDFQVALNGTLGTPDASGTLPTITTIRLGHQNATPIRKSPVWIRKITYLPRVYSNAELQARTA